MGLDFLKQFKSVTIEYPGLGPSITVSRSRSKVKYHLAATRKPSVIELPPARLVLDPNMLFQGLNRKVSPIKDKSRRYSIQDKKFIGKEVEKLLSQRIIEESMSAWRSQPVVAKKWVDGVLKNRFCIDYSRTINSATQEVAFPIGVIFDQCQ